MERQNEGFLNLKIGPRLECSILKRRQQGLSPVLVRGAPALASAEGRPATQL